MRYAAPLVLLLLAATLGSPPAARAAADEVEAVLAPLPVRGEFLLSSGYLALTPSTANRIPGSEWGFDLRLTSANTFAGTWTVVDGLVNRTEPSSWDLEHLRRQPGDVFVADGEVQRATATIRRGFGRGEVFASIPVLSTGTAWADELIDEFHTDFDLGRAGRPAIFPDDHFIYMRAGDREVVRSGAGETGPGDLLVGVKYVLPAYRGTSLATEVVVELPTGDRAALFGSGSLDAGVNFLASRRTERSTLFAAAGVAHLGEHAVLAVPERTIVAANLGYSRLLGRDDTAAVIQISVGDSPFRGLDWPELAEPLFQISLGLQFLLDSGLVAHVALVENALHYGNSADFALQLGLSAFGR
ncbi:MAG TPA: DUF3187 family protein [Thermoanaerobaculia bacterium]|nr:DUF3187 family protein [Thermoanaerobaculia bacterium]